MLEAAHVRNVVVFRHPRYKETRLLQGDRASDKISNELMRQALPPLEQHRQRPAKDAQREGKEAGYRVLNRHD